MTDRRGAEGHEERAGRYHLAGSVRYEARLIVTVLTGDYAGQRGRWRELFEAMLNDEEFPSREFADRVREEALGLLAGRGVDPDSEEFAEDGEDGG